MLKLSCLAQWMTYLAWQRWIYLNLLGIFSSPLIFGSSMAPFWQRACLDVSGVVLKDMPELRILVKDLEMLLNTRISLSECVYYCMHEQNNVHDTRKKRAHLNVIKLDYFPRESHEGNKTASNWIFSCGCLQLLCLPQHATVNQLCKWTGWWEIIPTYKRTQTQACPREGWLTCNKITQMLSREKS